MRAAITALTIAVLTLAGLHSAPLPRAKLPPSRTPIPGVWEMTWNAGTYRATFVKDGFYACEPGGWQGTWKLDGDTLRVAETSESGSSLEWAVTLEAGKLEGKLSSGGAFKLSVPKPDL